MEHCQVQPCFAFSWLLKVGKKVPESWKIPHKAGPDISHLHSEVGAQEKGVQSQADANRREALGNISGQQFAEEGAFLTLAHFKESLQFLDFSLMGL